MSNDTVHLNQDTLSSLVLNHWKRHLPKMLQQFQKEGRLQTELEATTEQLFDQMYCLVMVEKMPFPTAWEMVIETNLPAASDDDESSSSENQSENPPATSE